MALRVQPVGVDVGELNLFDVREDANLGWLHGSTFAAGTANVDVNFQRGVDLSAGINLQAEVGAQAGELVNANLAAGGRATAGLSLRANAPLDLFKEAGFVVRLRAQAAAAAYVRATIALDPQTFAGILEDRLGGPWGDLAEIFAREIEFGAGLWAQVGVSAQLVAEAAFVGSLIPVGTAPAGFTCSFQYAMGYYYGAGVVFRANYGIPNPPRLLDRLATRIGQVLDQEIRTALPEWDPAVQSAAQQALPLLPLILPLAFQSLYSLGKQLAASDTANASESLGEGLLRNAQLYVARALLDLAVRNIQALLDAAGVDSQLDALAGPDTTQLIRALLRVRTTILQLSTINDRAETWLDTLLALLDLLSLVTPLIPDEDEARWNDALALIWAAGIVIRQLIEWSEQAGGGSINSSAPVSFRGASSLGAYIARQVGKPPATAFTAGDAAAYLALAANDRILALREAFPELAPVFDVLEALFPGTAVIAALFNSIGQPDGERAVTLAGLAGAVLVPLIEERVLPQLIERLEAGAAPELQQLVREVIRPTLLSVSQFVLPRAAQATTPELKLALREGISSVLLQAIAKLMLTSTEILTEYAAREGPPAMRSLAAEARTGNQRAINSALGLLAPIAGIPPEWTPTVRDLADMLDLAADALEYWDQAERRNWFSLMERILTFSLATGDAALDTVWQTFEGTSPREPLPALLQILLDLANQVKESLWAALRQYSGRLMLLIVNHFKNLGEALLAPLAELAEGATDAVRRAVEWAGQLEQRIADLLGEIGARMQQIVAWIDELTGYLRTMQNTVIAAVREQGWALVEQALLDNAVFRALPDDWEALVRAGVRTLYDVTFTSLTWMLDVPLIILRDAAVWLREALNVTTQASRLDVNYVKQHLRARAAALLSPDLRLPIVYELKVGPVTVATVNLGDIVFPGSLIQSVLLDLVLNDTGVTALITQTVGAQNNIRASATEVNTLQTRLQNGISEAEGSAALANLSVVGPFEVSFAEPAMELVAVSSAFVTIEFRRGNRSFLTSVLGAPRRVRILVNGQEHQYSAENWIDQGDALVFYGRIVSTHGVQVPLPVLSAARYLPVELPQDAQLHVATDTATTPRLEITIAPPGGVVLFPPGSGPVMGPALPQPRRDLLLELLGNAQHPTTFDPLLGVSVTVAVGSVTPVVVQRPQFFSASLAEHAVGYHWATYDELIGTVPFVPTRESIPTQPGPVQVDVLVVDSAGNGQLFQGPLFILT